MKKILLATILLSCLYSCNSSTDPKNYENSNVEKKTDDIQSNKVSIVITPTHYNIGNLSGKASLTMVNNTQESITTGEGYSIAYFDKGEWKTLDAFKEISFISIGHTIPNGGTKVFTITFYSDKHSYKKGKYRVAKYFSRNNEEGPKSTQEVYAEFIVE